MIDPLSSMQAEFSAKNAAPLLHAGISQHPKGVREWGVISNQPHFIPR